MKKYLIVLALIPIVFISMCNNPLPEPSFEISKEICEVKEIGSKVIVIHQTGCGACAVALPRLEELEKEMNKEFEYINLAKTNGQMRINELEIIQYIKIVPTVIINCKGYTGALEKEIYKKLIEVNI